MKYTVIFLMVVTIFGCSTPNLKISTGNSEKGTAYLLNTTDQKIDTIAYKNYYLSFSDEINEPTLFHLYFDEIKNWNRPIYLILSKETTEIKFDSIIASNENAASWSGLYPNRPEFMIDPNKNESFYRFQNLWISFSDSIISMSNNEDEIITQKKNSEDLYNEFISKCGIIISENKDRLISAFIMEYLMNNNLLELNKIQEYYTVLDTAVQQSDIGKRIGKESCLKIKTKAPDFEVIDNNGNVYNLDKLKDKKILLHFWSTTCAHCIREIPTLLELNDYMKDLIIINISLDTDSDRWENGVSKLGMAKMINICDFQGNKSKIAQDYYIKTIPANYLLSEQGKIISKK